MLVDGVFLTQPEGSHTQTGLHSTRTLTLPPPTPHPGYALTDRRGVHIKATSGVCFSGTVLGELRSGLHSLSVCQCGRFKLLRTCSDEGLVVLICVKSQQRD